MPKKIMGISGSPIPNGNTDRLVKQVLASSGMEGEFVKLSDHTVGPCRACKRCASDNVCKVNDDFPPIAARLLETDAIVLGGYTPYGMLDAFTKSFLERLWSMRHVHNLNRGKLVVTAISGLYEEGRLAVLRSMAIEMMMERTRHVAQLQIQGNVPCLTCGYGDDCWGSGAKRLHPGEKASADLCVPVEHQPVWKEATRIGELIGRHFSGESIDFPDISETLNL
jgi:multimeric flavodoxin WrbA